MCTVGGFGGKKTAIVKRAAKKEETCKTLILTSSADAK